MGLRNRYRAGSIAEALERRTLLAPLSALPLLSSRAGAPVTIHLDFDGTPAFEFNDADDTWASGPAAGDSDPIPAFSIDGNVNDFTQGELDGIGAIWQQVKEKFSPFDINVTTVAPPNYNDGVAVHAIIGGSNMDWAGGTGGGIAPLNAFTNGRPNSGFVWSADVIDAGSVTLSLGDRHFIAETAAHEVGHTMGLQHQSVVDGTGTVTVEYSNGVGSTTPIMGNSSNNSGNRGMWWNGPSSDRNGSTLTYLGFQDDLAVLTRPGNFINYRVDDFGSFSGSGSISVNGSTGAASAQGVIERVGDQDAFTFTAIGPVVQLTVRGGDFGGMLAPTLELIPIGAAAAGSVTLTTTNTSATLNATGLTPGGGYVLRVSPQGNAYGNIGQYSIAGNTGAFAVLSGGVLTINGFDTVNDLLISYHGASDTIVLQDDVFGGSAVMQFARAQVNEIRVQFGSYFHDDEINVLGQFSGLTIPIHVVAGSVGTDRLVLHGTTGNDVMSLGFFDHFNNNTPVITVGIEQFVLTGFDGADTYNVNAVPENVLVTVHAGGGNDVINVAPAIEAARVRSPILVNGEAGDDTLNLGGGWLDSVGGLVTFNGGATGSAVGNRVIFNDQVGFIPYSYVIGPTSVTRDPHFAGLTYFNTQRLILYASAGHNTVTVGSGVSPIVEAYGNDGNDNFVVGGGMMDGGAGPIVGGFNGGNGTDQITYDDHLRTTGVIWDVRPTQVFYGGIFQLNTNAFEAVGILAGNGDDQIFFYNDIGSKIINVDAGGGNDVIDTNHARALSLSIAGGAGSDKLEVDDVGIPTGTLFQHYVTPGFVQRYDFIAEYYVFYSAMEQLDVVLPGQQNNVYIGGTSAGFTQILGTTLTDNVIVTPRDGAGNPTIGGQLNIFCGDGTDTFEIDATASNTPSEYLIGSDNLFGFNPGVTMVGGGGILVQHSEAWRVRAGGGMDTFRVNTFPGLGVTPSLELSGGNENDTFYIDSFKTGTPLTVNAGAGNDLLYLGNGHVKNNISSIGTFTYNGGPDFDSYVVLNSNSTAIDGYYVSPGAFSVLPSGGSFVVANHTGLESISAHAGSAGDRFDVYGTNPGETISLNGEGGNDLYQFGSIFTVTLQPIRSAVFINGGTGADNVSLLNYDDGAGRTYHVTQSHVSAAAGDNLFGAGGSLAFNSVGGTLTIENGNHADTIYAQPNTLTRLAINGSNPTTAPGDRLFLAFAGATGTTFTPQGVGAGTYAFANRGNLAYTGIETTATDTAAPQILSRTFTPTATGQSVSFAFDEDVSASLNINSLHLFNSTGGVVIDAAVMSYAYVGNVATWTFPGLGGVLGSGVYTATLNGAADAFGQGATGSNTWRFIWAAGGAGADSFRVNQFGGFLEIFVNGSATPTYSVKSSTLNQVNIHGGDGNDTFMLDALRGGVPTIPTGGHPVFNGGGGTGDRFGMIGTAAANTAAFDATSATIDGVAFAHAGVEGGVWDGAGGDDVLAINAGGVVFSASQRFASLTLSAGTSALLDALGEKMLIVKALSIAAGATLDLTDNDLLWDYADDGTASPYATLRGYVVTGRNTGTGGIVSTPTGDTVMAVVDNAQYGRSTFDGIPIDATTLIGKYTYFGDANLDGKVTGDDYLNVDANLGLSGAQWFQGDFNFSGVTTGDDYLAIDANLGKGTLDPLAFADDREAMIEIHAAQFGGDAYVKAVEQAAKGNYAIDGMKKTGRKRLLRS